MINQIEDTDRYFGEWDLRDLFEQANQDSDAASGWWLCQSCHTPPEERDGLIVIIKGSEAALKAYSLLCNHGLLTPGKPITENP